MPVHHGDRRLQKRQSGLLSPTALIPSGIKEPDADRFHSNHASGHILCTVGFEETDKSMGTSAARENEEQVIEYTLPRDVFDQKQNDTKS